MQENNEPQILTDVSDGASKVETQKELAEFIIAKQEAISNPRPRPVKTTHKFKDADDVEKKKQIEDLMNKYRIELGSNLWGAWGRIANDLKISHSQLNYFRKVLHIDDEQQKQQETQVVSPQLRPLKKSDNFNKADPEEKRKRIEDAMAKHDPKKCGFWRRVADEISLEYSTLTYWKNKLGILK
jgi:hypothetical protein